MGTRIKADDGFMGYTHAISALGITLACIAFVPGVVGNVLNTHNGWVFAAAILAATGSVLIPDLDNTSSRAKSDLGPFGIVLSGLFRTTSTVLQTTIRTKRDDPDPNPHRGAWHTLPACLLLGFIVWMLTRIEGNITLPFLGNITWGAFFAFLILAVLVHLTLSTLMKEAMDKIKKSVAIGEIVALTVSAIIAVLIMTNIPVETDFWWLGVAVAFGSAIHVLGDCFTTAGAPILFPLSAVLRGKFWWTTRFLPIKAGGPVENYLFVPAFLVLSLVSLGKIILDMTIGQ
jgi:membrane-bound metal-dependent hydrolase YbcI (DUF457 family)